MFNEDEMNEMPSLAERDRLAALMGTVEYRRMRNDVTSGAYEFAKTEGGVVVSSGVRLLDAEWQTGDPFHNDWVGSHEADLLAAGFEHPEQWRVWMNEWIKALSLL